MYYETSDFNLAGYLYATGFKLAAHRVDGARRYSALTKQPRCYSAWKITLIYLPSLIHCVTEAL